MKVQTIYPVMKGTTSKLYYYFKPSKDNFARTCSFFAAILVLPTANLLLPKIFLHKTKPDSFRDQLILNIEATILLNVLEGLYDSATQVLSKSLMQGIRKTNVGKLTDNNKFLLHANIKDITSLQYVTVGLGTRDFAEHAVLMFITLPLYITSFVITGINIVTTEQLFKTSEVILGFVATAGICMYGAFNRYFFL